jgi:hypothetical protein
MLISELPSEKISEVRNTFKINLVRSATYGKVRICLKKKQENKIKNANFFNFQARKLVLVSKAPS